MKEIDYWLFSKVKEPTTLSHMIKLKKLITVISKDYGHTSITVIVKAKDKLLVWLSTQEKLLKAFNRMWNKLYLNIWDSFSEDQN
jgi:hypothetical protein